VAQKISAQGAVMEVVDPVASPDTFVIIGNFRGATGIRSGTRTEIDVTDMQSTSKEYLLGLKDPGSMQINLLYDPMDAGQIILENLLNSSVAVPFRLSVPNPAVSPPFTTLTYNGFVSVFPFDVAVDAGLPGTVTVRVTGDYVKG
jgi:Lambda phage tail tube protein, TTP